MFGRLAAACRATAAENGYETARGRRVAAMRGDGCGAATTTEKQSYGARRRCVARKHWKRGRTAVQKAAECGTRARGNGGCGREGGDAGAVGGGLPRAVRLIA